jgi:hypothetical protein
MDGTRFDEEMPQREEFSHDIRDVHEENKDREQVQSKPLQVLSVVVSLDGLYMHCIFLS